MNAPENTPNRPPLVAAHAPIVEAKIIEGPGQGEAVRFRRAANLIGSSQGCKLRLMHVDVSSVHAAVINNGEKTYLRDLASTAGTYLNDLPVEFERLRNGDVVKITPWRLRFSIRQPDHEDANDYTGLSLDPAPIAVIMLNLKNSHPYKLTREVSLLGRRHNCDIAIEDPSVSRAHALVFSYLFRPALLDLMSANSTRVNGQRTVCHPLSNDDVVSLGSAEFRVRLVQPNPHFGNGQRKRQAPEAEAG